MCVFYTKISLVRFGDLLNAALWHLSPHHIFIIVVLMRFKAYLQTTTLPILLLNGVELTLTGVI